MLVTKKAKQSAIIILWCVILAGITLSFCWLIGEVNLEATETKQAEILSPKDFQTLLNEIEPQNPIVVDGIIGKQTVAKWERVYCNQCAARTFE